MGITWKFFLFLSHPHLFLEKQDQQKSSFTSTVSSEASCSISSPESTFNSQESSSSLVSKVVFSEKQSWLDLVSCSATEEGDQPLTFCVQIHSDEPPEVDCGEAAESQEVQLSKPSGGPQNSFLDLDTCCLAVPDATGQRSLAKGEPMRGYFCLQSHTMWEFTGFPQLPFPFLPLFSSLKSISVAHNVINQTFLIN